MAALGYTASHRYFMDLLNVPLYMNNQSANNVCKGMEAIWKPV